MAESKRPAHRIAPNSFSVSVRLGKPRRPRAIWRRPTRRACLASLLLVAAIAVVRAHDAAQTRASAPTSSAVVGVVSGRVTDEAGRALAGVTIRLTCSRTVAVVVTSDAGTDQMNAPGPSPSTASLRNVVGTNCVWPMAPAQDDVMLCGSSPSASAIFRAARNCRRP